MLPQRTQKSYKIEDRIESEAVLESLCLKTESWSHDVIVGIISEGLISECFDNSDALSQIHDVDYPKT